MTFLTDTEVQRIILSFLHGNGTSTEEEITKAVDWAEDVRLQSELLDAVLEGQLCLLLRDGKIAFKGMS